MEWNFWVSIVQVNISHSNLDAQISFINININLFFEFSGSRVMNSRKVISESKYYITIIKVLTENYLYQT